ncbi:hypothetical protein B9Z19DRAFT_1192016 [Tuber borchii]|uniref:Uncharacterized protein n=1 Tax=Tuber borchii TaxID=42251 RepID=A0A2T6ZXG0_TUBBO|nr:hypothetical protein B9Z19DRAFT_1192016 [Tuber borchii]
MSTTDEDSVQTTPPTNRLAWRDTNIYGSDTRDTLIGGLWASEGITNAYLYSMLEIICFFTNTFYLYDDRKQLVRKDGQQLRPGNYFVVTTGSISVTDEVPLICAVSLPSGPRVESFRESVFQRDRQCVITGNKAMYAHVGRWMGFEATHIFSLAFERQWNDRNLSRLITVPPANESHGSINSVQNGIMLTCEMHRFFASYELAINPDDNYKIVCFTADLSPFHIAGRHLDQTFIDNPLRPPDDLLRWHFRQAVLVNIKGVGEPTYEDDFPP